MSNEKYLGNSVTSFGLAKIMVVSAERYWRQLYFTDEHTFGLLEENKQAHNMSMLIPHEGTERIGKSQSLIIH